MKKPMACFASRVISSPFRIRAAATRRRMRTAKEEG